MMKNILVYTITILTLIGCSAKRESDIDSKFGTTSSTPGGLTALPSTETTPKDTEFNSVVPFVPLTNGGASVFTVITNPQHGTVVMNPNNGNYEYTPNLNYVGTDSFTWSVTQNNQTATSVVNINVTPVNQAPIANNSSSNGNQGTVISGTLSASDPNNDPLTYILVSNPTNGTVVINNGSFSYTPNSGYFGPDSFTFKVNDGQLNSNTATVSITVAKINQAPIAVNGNVSINEDTTYTSNLIATDIDSSSLTYSIVTNPQHGAVTINPSTGTYVYTPNNNYNGPDSFTFKANDGLGLSNTATIQITVTPLNDSPIANNLSFNTNEDTVLNNNLAGLDIDNDPISYSIISMPIHGTLTFSPMVGSFVYTPNANYNGSDSFLYQVSDGTSLSNIATVSINVNPINDAPIANNSTINVNYNNPYQGNLTATDIDSNSLTYTIVNNPTKGTVTITNASTGAFTYNPNLNAIGSDSFTFKVNDGSLDSNIATVSITIVKNNILPIASNVNLTTQEEQSVNGNFVATDANNDSLTYSIVMSPSKGSVTIINSTTGSFIYTPSANTTGVDHFTYQANDGTGNSNIASVYITINNVNDAPVALNDQYQTNEDTPVNIVLAGTDADNNLLTYTIVSNPAKGTLSGSGQFKTYTPNLNANGVDSFTFKVNDGTTDSNIATITIVIKEINDLPVANNLSFNMFKNTTYSGNVTASDVESTSLLFSIVSTVSHGTITLNSNNGAFSYTPNSGYFGTDSFTFRVYDGQGFSNTATVSINVINPNQAPIAQNASYSTPEDTPYGGNLQAQDPNGDQLSYTIITQPTKGTLVTQSNGTFTYTPNANYNGNDSFTFKANDGALDSNIGTITLTINPVNDLPTALNQSITVNQNSNNNPIILVGTDVETTNLNFNIVANPSHGTLSGSGANVFYTPNANYTGNDSFTFKVNDGTSDSNVATVSIVVNSLGGWCNANLQYSHKLVFNNQDLLAHSNIPVMVKLNNSRINYNEIKANGQDIRFYDSNCNLLNHEIERWNTNGDSFVWVKVPSINANSNASFIWMYYGNNTYTDIQNKNAVWSNSFTSVWHLEETSGVANDSTVNNNQLTTIGSPLRNTGGKIAGGELNDSNDDGFLAADTSSLRLNNSLSMESWIYITEYSPRGHIFEKHFANKTKIDYALFIDNGKPMIIIGAKEYTANVTLAKNQWHHVTGTYNKTNNTCKIYVNGVEKLSTTGCSVSPVGEIGSNNALKVGNDNPAGNVFKGAYDELRISNTVRSPDWIKAQHLTMTDGFISYGTKRTIGESFNHTLMTIKMNNDDGKLYTPNDSYYPSGHNGIDYHGSSQGRPIWGYYRFQLPHNLPANATIKKAMIRLYGKNTTNNFANQYLVIGAQNSGNAPAISSGAQYPGSPTVSTVGVGSSWGAPSLSWKLDDWNDSPNFKDVIVNLKNNTNGINNGAYIQLFITKSSPFGNIPTNYLASDVNININYLLGLSNSQNIPVSPQYLTGLNNNLLNSLNYDCVSVCSGNNPGINCQGTTMEVGSEDNAAETLNHAQLMIEWE